MPSLSRWMIRLSLLNCWLGITVASLLLSIKGVPEHLPPKIWGWVPAHVDLLMVGWMVQLAMGVAYWILPRLPNSLKVRGRFAFAISAAVLINGGVWMASAGILLLPSTVWLQLLGTLLQLIAVIAFAIHAWPRIRPAFAKAK